MVVNCIALGRLIIEDILIEFTLFQYSDRHVYTASVDGEIQVYTYTRKSLSCVYRSEDLKLRGGGAVLCRPVRSLVQCKGRIYFGDDGCSVKALDWSEGTVNILNVVGLWPKSLYSCNEKV